MIARRALLVSGLGLVVATLAIACTKPDEPMDPAWGKEPCAHCAMLVSDKRYAGQVVAGGDRKFFDDVGCMVLWLDAHEAAPVAHVWARDSTTGRWVEAKGARYFASAQTPMDFGFEARGGEGGIGWEEMRERVRQKAKEGRR